ncbi:MAG: methylmalonyl Co-A mutase-associated GTPase MeaB [Cyclobacteriaceae bacterium]|nr:methylmalonyl Co-A mutase-associated GTPase MeaB [Cyclobacteriaceae bacterium]
MKPQKLTTNELLQRIYNSDLLGLSKGITLIESTLEKDRLQAEELLNNLLPKTGKSIRIGITGVPGVGKSTFIEAFGEYLIKEKQKRVAVLAIDPSSQQTKGSILGDKTRMEKLAANPMAFIRPSPSGKSLGGVANKTRETLLLCEAAGYDVTIIETVGVGQSETAVKGMTDFFLLLMLSGAGDELQGIKRGIMEMADLLAINKADGDNIKKANLAKAAYKNALHLLPPHEFGWTPETTTCSSLTGDGIEAIWKTIESYYDKLEQNDGLIKIREKQQKEWLKETLQSRLLEDFLDHSEVRKRLPVLENQVIAGKIIPSTATRELIKLVLS